MKRGDVIEQRAARTAEPESQPAELREPSIDASPCLDDVHIPDGRDLWTSLEAAAYLRLPTLNAFYSWVCRLRVPHERRGKQALYRQRDLDEALRKDRRRVAPSRSLLVAHTRRAS